MDFLTSIIVLIISASSVYCLSNEEILSSEIFDLSRHLTLPSVEAIDYYGTGVGVARSRFSRPVRQVKFGGPGFGGPIPVIGGNSHSQAQAASLNVGPFGASVSSANALSNSHAGGYPGIGSHFGGPIGYGGPGFHGSGFGNSHASAAASSGAGGFFGGPGYSQSQAAASAGSSGFGGGYPYGGGFGYPGGFGGGYGYPGGFGGGYGGYPGGFGLHHGGHYGHHGHGYPGGIGGYPGGFGGNYGLYPGAHGHYPGGAFLGYGRGGLRSAGNGETASKATAGAGARSDSIKF